MLALWEVVLLLLLAVAVLLYQGVAITFAYQMPRLGPTPSPAKGTMALPELSVVIAARNEVEDLPRTLDDLLAKDAPPSEIVVVDGGSTDGSAAVIEARAPRVRRLEEPELPPG